ncbi:hypothetical protein GCM10020260_18030 [Nesterenkonia halobia]|uniref:Uncharacterized protein n=1 Tax=Nesterenkonia halobia TaxID=37922 RepID=A0ABP6RHP7_9MICC
MTIGSRAAAAASESCGASTPTASPAAMPTSPSSAVERDEDESAEIVMETFTNAIANHYQ